MQVTKHDTYTEVQGSLKEVREYFECLGCTLREPHGSMRDATRFQALKDGKLVSTFTLWWRSGLATAQHKNDL